MENNQIKKKIIFMEEFAFSGTTYTFINKLKISAANDSAAQLPHKWHRLNVLT